MRAARPEYDAPSVRTADASDIGPQHPARYRQNDCEIALNRKNALFAGHDQGGALGQSKLVSRPFSAILLRPMLTYSIM